MTIFLLNNLLIYIQEKFHILIHHLIFPSHDLTQYKSKLLAYMLEGILQPIPREYVIMNKDY